MTAGEWLRSYTSVFQQAGIGQAAEEAMALLCHALKLDKARVFAQPERAITSQELELLEGLAGRRLKREPSAYITQHREFYSLDFFVDHRVLIPRPETEVLVEEAVKFARARTARNKETLTIVDVGTGSGAIAVALAAHIPGSLVYALDISAAALEVAAINITRHGLGDRVIPVQSDLLQQISARVDIIAANLPYVPQSAARLLQPEVAGHEPGTALWGGVRGTEIIVNLLGQASDKINPGGALFLEIDEGQETELVPAASRYLPGCRFTLVKDLSGINRVIEIEAKCEAN